MGDYSKGKSEKEGLIPVTCKIIRSLGKKDEKLEYMNIPVTEISIVGMAYNYNEHETKIIVGLWDQTGYIEVTFFNKTESDSHFGLDGYLHKDRGIVKVIGKVKYYNRFGGQWRIVISDAEIRPRVNVDYSNLLKKRDRVSLQETSRRQMQKEVRWKRRRLNEDSDSFVMNDDGAIKIDGDLTILAFDDTV